MSNRTLCKINLRIMVNKNTVLRIARPTNFLELISNIYKNGLGLEELGSFKDHSCFNGMVGYGSRILLTS